MQMCKRLKGSMHDQSQRFVVSPFNVLTLRLCYIGWRFDPATSSSGSASYGASRSQRPRLLCIPGFPSTAPSDALSLGCVRAHLVMQGAGGSRGLGPELLRVYIEYIYLYIINIIYIFICFIYLVFSACYPWPLPSASAS